MGRGLLSALPTSPQAMAMAALGDSDREAGQTPGQTLITGPGSKLMTRNAHDICNNKKKVCHVTKLYNEILVV